MKAILSSLATLLAIAIAGAAVASAQTVTVTGGSRSDQVAARTAEITPEMSAAINARAARALLVAQKIRERTGGMSDAGYTNLSLALLGASEAGLDAAASARSYKEAIAAIRTAGQAPAQRVKVRPSRSAGSETEDFGSSTASEFVFYPIVPCRLLDTREVGTRLSSLTPYLVDFDGGNSGNAVGCTRSGVAAQLGGTTAGLERAALVINLTATGSTVNGWIQARPVGSTAFTSNQNFYPGQNIANMVVVQNSGASSADFELIASQPTHAIVDVLGVFAPPVASALECVDMQEDASSLGNIENNMSVVFPDDAALCSGGYTSTSIRCEFGYFPPPTGLSHATISGASCWWNNATGGPLSGSLFVVKRRCCRTPGRQVAPGIAGVDR